LIDNFRANSLIYTDFRVHGEPRECTTGNCRHIYHIAQEALNNILKHSGATMVEVNLTFLPGWMELSLKDNGQGFNYRTPEKNESGFHRGLLNMLERSNLMGAVLNINSDKGKGTVIKLTLETGGKANEKDQDIDCR
jgi:signal transduction histidine kinase